MKATRRVFFGLSTASPMLVAGLAAEGAAAPCIDLKQSQTVSFEGSLTHKVFPGPPNYEDVRKGDKPEPAYILQLRKPIYVSGDESLDPKQQIDRIQIFPESADDKPLWNALRKLAGKSVKVEGSEPFGAITGHHHAPLLLPITKIAPTDHHTPQ
jgi:hypothetical protein